MVRLTHYCDTNGECNSVAHRGINVNEAARRAREIN
jgi:hypothetical protein